MVHTQSIPGRLLGAIWGMGVLFMGVVWLGVDLATTDGGGFWEASLALFTVTVGVLVGMVAVMVRRARARGRDAGT